MKKGEDYSSAFMTNEVEKMVEALRARPGYKKRPATKEQAKSTTEALARQATRKPEDDEEYWNRPLPPESEWKVEADAEKVFAEVNKASITDIVLAEGLRHKPRNQLGQSELSATTPEKRASAIHHFEVAGNVKADQVELERIVGLTEIKSEPPRKEQWVRMNWFQAMVHWFKGNKIRNDKDGYEGWRDIND